MTMKKIKDKIAQYLKDKTFLRYLLYSIYIVITTCVLFVFLTHPAIRGFFASIENKTFDIRQNILSPYKKVNKNIVILTIDEESHEYLFGKYGEWPISRGIYADMINYLESHKPAAVAFDLMFVKSLKSSLDEDKKLGRTMSSYDNVFTSINFDNLPYDLRQPVCCG